MGRIKLSKIAKVTSGTNPEKRRDKGGSDEKNNQPFHEKYWWLPGVASLVSIIIAVTALIVRLRR